MASATRSEEAGLIVVGASVAGLIAAITAADHGRRVVLIERSKDIGGLAATSSESVAAAGTRFQRVADVHDAPEQLLADMGGATGDHVESTLAHALVMQGASLVEWLADRCGVQVALQSITALGGHTAPRLHSMGEQGGATLMSTLARTAAHHTHIRIRTATDVQRLVPSDDGAVVGVGLRPDRRGSTIVNGPVALACGGFVANDELVAQHCPDAKELPYPGPAGARGDALQLAGPLGTAIRHGSACGVTALLAQPSHLVVSRAVIEHGGILVNQRGVRFADESQPSLPLALAVRAQPGRVAYLLFDERMAAAVAAHDPFFARVVLPRTSRRASSVGMLSKQLELPESSLSSTLEVYNAQGGADPFGRRGATSPLTEPYYGIRVTGARRATRGGLAVDAQARVLDAGGNAIVGLYAMGGAAAGLASDGIESELTGIDALTALGLARLAALSLPTVADEG